MQIFFKSLTKAEFMSITKLDNYLYFITDTQEIYKGNVAYSSSSIINLTISENIDSALSNLNTLLQNNSSINEVQIILGANISTTNSDTITQDVDFVLDGQNRSLTLSNDFALNGLSTIYKNVAFNLADDLVVNNNTYFENCKFTSANNKKIIIENSNSNTTFNNCIIGLDVDIDTGTGLNLINFNNCVFTNSKNLNVNSENASDIINIGCVHNLNLNVDTDTQATIYSNPVFRTVTTTGGGN